MKLKTKDLNSKACEAYANHQIELGSALFKGALFSLFILPITLIVKFGARPVSPNDSSLPFEWGLNIETSSFIILAALWCLAVYIGDKFREQGITILHKLEER